MSKLPACLATLASLIATAALPGPAIAHVTTPRPTTLLRWEPAVHAKRADVPVRPFADDALWNARVDQLTALSASSATLSASLGRMVTADIAAQRGPWLEHGFCSTPIYTVGADQPQVPVALSNPTTAWRVTLASALASVPMPDGLPASCPDGSMTIYQPSTDRMWELFHASRAADGWHADWGGAIAQVTKSRGFYDVDSWAGGQANWGPSASSRTLLGGIIRLDELRAGAIPHAIAINLPDTAAGRWAAPAQRTDGTDTRGSAIPEGAHFRLDPALDLDSLGLPPATLVIARAAQRYGIVVRDRTHNAVSMLAEAPLAGEPDPYPGFFGGKGTAEIMRAFPWKSLQLLPMSIRKPPPPPA